eukprot:Awhi_evm1s1997
MSLTTLQNVGQSKGQAKISLKLKQEEKGDDLKNANKTQVEKKKIMLFNEWIDVTNFHQWHPGGSEILLFYENEDATDVFEAFHVSDKPLRMLKTLPRATSDDTMHIAPKIDPAMERRQERDESIKRDWRNLVGEWKEKGYFQADPWFVVGWLIATISVEMFILLTWFPYQNLITSSLETPILSLMPIAAISASSSSLLMSLLSRMSVSVLTISLQVVFFILKALPALVYGFAMGQQGFVMHCFGHSSSFRNVYFDYLAQILTITVILGDSARSWNVKHNKHHAKTNVFMKDPDIQPLFFWKKPIANHLWPLRVPVDGSEEDESQSAVIATNLPTESVPSSLSSPTSALSSKYTVSHKWLLRLQHFYVYFLYSLFVFSRQIDSWYFVFGLVENNVDLKGRLREQEKKNTLQSKKNDDDNYGPDANNETKEVRRGWLKLELGALILHWSGVVWLFYASGLPFWTFMLHYYLAYSLMGLYLGMVFTANHNHMPIDMSQSGEHETNEQNHPHHHSHHDKVASSSSSSSSNSSSCPVSFSQSNLPMNWIEMNCIGTINYEDNLLCSWLTEHHLCPTMPVYNYPYINQDVKDLCLKYGIEYNIKPYFEALSDNHEMIKDVAHQF